MDQAKKNKRTVGAEAQGHFFKLSVGGFAAQSGGGVRGVIAEFSASSRKRMLETLARVAVELAGFVCFATLTYPDCDGPPTAAESERDRQTFLKRIHRRHKDASGIWRREWKCRQSGEFIGAAYPHFHVLFFGLPFVHCEIINDIWREVIGHDGYVRTEIKGIKSWKHALGYVAKYMAKVSTATPARTAAGGTVPAEGPAAVRGGEAAACSLVYVSYLTAEKRKKERVGRAWGLFNRRKIPFGEKTQVLLPHGVWVEIAKDEARKFWKGVNEYPNCGFSLFDDDPQRWMRLVCGLGEINPNQFNAEGEYDPLPF